MIRLQPQNQRSDPKWTVKFKLIHQFYVSDLIASLESESKELNNVDIVRLTKFFIGMNQLSKGANREILCFEFMIDVKIFLSFDNMKNNIHGYI